MADPAEINGPVHDDDVGPAGHAGACGVPIGIASARSYRLLLVEINLKDAELVRNWLQDAPRAAVHLHHVAHVEVALSALEQSSYDGVVLDLGLPGSRGLDTLEQLLRSHEELPIVVLSGEGDHALHARVIALGAHDCLDKGAQGPAIVRSVLYAMERARALRQQRQLHQLIAASSDALVVSVDGVARCINRAAEALLGCPAPELIGRPLSFTAANGQRIELEAPPGSQRRVEVELQVASVDWANEVATLITLRDVTVEREATERTHRMQRLEAVGHLVGGVAHEFNNLLTVIESFATLVQDDMHSTDPKRSDIDQIVCAAQTGQELVSHLVELYGWSAPAPRQLDLIELARSVQRWLKRTLPLGIELRLQAPQGSLPVCADPAALKGALVSLVAHMTTGLAKGGAITVALSARTLEEPTDDMHGPCAVVQVYDHETDLDLSRACEPSSSIRAGREPQRSGLELCHSIVQQAGGRILVEHESKRGGCYTLLFPLTSHAAQPKRGTRRRRTL